MESSPRRVSDALLKKPPERWPDGEGLFFKPPATARPTSPTGSRSVARKPKRASGLIPEMTLDEARIRHLELRALVLKGIDPVVKRQAKAAPSAQRRTDVRLRLRRLPRPAGGARRTGQEPETPAAMAQHPGFSARVVPRASRR